MEFPYSTKNIASIIVFTSAFLNVMLSIWVILNTQHQRKVNRVFASLCATAGLFSFSFVFLNLSEASFAKIYWLNVYVFCLLFASPIIFHQIVQSLSRPSRNERGTPTSRTLERLKQFAYAFTVGLFLLALKGRLFNLADGHTFEIPILESPYQWIVVIFGALLISGLTLIIKFASKAIDQGQRKRLLLVGIPLTWLGILFSSFLVIPIHYLSSWIVPMMFCLITITLLMLAIPVTSTRLYQIADIIRQGMSHFLTAFVMCMTFISMQVVTTRIFKGENISFIEVFALSIGSIVTAFLILPRRFYLEKLTDRLFFNDRYAQVKKIEELWERLSLCEDKNSLLNTLFDGLRKSEIGFMTGCLILKASKKSFFRIVQDWGLPPETKGFLIKEDHFLIQYLKMEKKEILADNMLNRILADWDRRTLKDALIFLKSDICFPIYRSQDHALVGLISLGNPKLGPSSYVGRNLFWLRNVMERAATMLDNFITHEHNSALIPYAGKSVADDVFRNQEEFRGEQEGERTWVSVMMVDIRHFTSLTNQLDPQTVVKLLKEFRSLVSLLVEREGGAVDKFIGDAVMASFGLPILIDRSTPDKKAIQCALDIIKEIDSLNKKNRWIHGHKLSVGIGIASGNVIAGNVDSGTRTEYTVIGGAPNMVARLEDMAQENQILLSPLTFNKVMDEVRVIEWPPQRIDGFDTPVAVYELKGIGVPKRKSRPDTESSKPAVNE